MPLITDLYFGGPVECTLVWDEERTLHPFHQNGTPPPKDAIKVTYNSGYMTRDYFREMEKVREQNEEWVVHWQFRQIIQKWDVLKAPKQPILIDKESIEALPVDLLNAVVAGVMEDLHPKRETPTS